jgi:hypothetical protein
MANNAPIFSSIANTDLFNGITAANTNLDGTGTLGTDIFEVFVSAATFGSWFQGLVISPRGTNVVSVMRIFLNNGGANSTASNNAKIGEVTLPATTASAIAAIPSLEFPFNRPLAPGYRILVTLGTAVAGGYAVTSFGGDYTP